MHIHSDIHARYHCSAWVSQINYLCYRIDPKRTNDSKRTKIGCHRQTSAPIKRCPSGNMSLAHQSNHCFGVAEGSSQVINYRLIQLRTDWTRMGKHARWTGSSTSGNSAVAPPPWPGKAGWSTRVQNNSPNWQVICKYWLQLQSLNQMYRDDQCINNAQKGRARFVSQPKQWGNDAPFTILPDTLEALTLSRAHWSLRIFIIAATPTWPKASRGELCVSAKTDGRWLIGAYRPAPAHIYVYAYVRACVGQVARLVDSWAALHRCWRRFHEIWRND